MNKRVVDCFFKSIITTMTILTVSFLLMLFKSGELGMRKTYFDTIFFNPTELADGGIVLKFGFTSNYAPIIITFVVVFIYYCTLDIWFINFKNNKSKVDQKNK